MIKICSARIQRSFVDIDVGTFTDSLNMQTIEECTAFHETAAAGGANVGNTMLTTNVLCEHDISDKESKKSNMNGLETRFSKYSRVNML